MDRIKKMAKRLGIKPKNRVEPKPTIPMYENKFVPIDGNVRSIELMFKAFRTGDDSSLGRYNISHIISSHLLGRQIFRFLAAFGLRWTRKDMNACMDIGRNVFKNTNALMQAVASGCSIVIMGKDLTAMIDRMKKPFSDRSEMVSIASHRPRYTISIALVKVVPYHGRITNARGTAIREAYLAKVINSIASDNPLLESIDPEVAITCILTDSSAGMFVTPMMGDEGTLTLLPNVHNALTTTPRCDRAGVPISHIDTYVVNREGVSHQQVAVRMGRNDVEVYPHPSDACLLVRLMPELDQSTMWCGSIKLYGNESTMFGMGMSYNEVMARERENMLHQGRHVLTFYHGKEGTHL